MRAASLKFKIYITAGIYSIVLTLVKSHDLHIELQHALTISKTIFGNLVD